MAGTKFSGDRYRKNGEQAIMLLYDRNGYIAGIQAGVCMVYVQFRFNL